MSLSVVLRRELREWRSLQSRQRGRGLTPDLVHDLRVASRRLQAVLRLLDHKNKPLRSYCRALGKARDVEMLGERLASLKPWSPTESSLFRNLNHELRALYSDIDPFTIRLPDSVLTRTIETAHLGRVLHRTMKRVARADRSLRENPGTTSRHRLRRAVRRLRFTAEALEQAGYPSWKAVRQEARYWQSLLGRLQDREVLRVRLTRHPHAGSKRLRTLMERAARDAAQTFKRDWRLGLRRLEERVALALASLGL